MRIFVVLGNITPSLRAELDSNGPWVEFTRPRPASGQARRLIIQRDATGAPVVALDLGDPLSEGWATRLADEAIWNQAFNRNDGRFAGLSQRQCLVSEFDHNSGARFFQARFAQLDFNVAQFGAVFTQTKPVL